MIMSIHRAISSHGWIILALMAFMLVIVLSRLGREPFTGE